MKIAEHFSQSGELFFRLRGHLPLLAAPLILAAFAEVRYPYDSHALDLLWELGCFFIAATGVGIRVAVSGCSPAGTSGRNRRGQRAELLNTTGLYSVVRHPLYLGNYLIIVGMAMFPRAWYLPLIVTLAYIVYYERIIYREEEFLEEKFGEDFRAWARRTPLMLPQWRLFRPSALPFEWRAALCKECYAMAGVPAAFFFLDVVEDYVVEGTLELDPLWSGLFIGALCFFVAVRVLRKTTKILHVQGR
jgi:protein-S-isoprenylcysteine O-methyltransferase Ste14